MKLIDKSALVAEIERRIAILENNSNGIISMLASGMFVNEYKDLLSLLDTLEVKEVDLDVMQRMEECPYRRVGCTMYADKILDCNGACSWVVDYPKVKELKAQKGE